MSLKELQEKIKNLKSDMINSDKFYSQFSDYVDAKKKLKIAEDHLYAVKRAHHGDWSKRSDELYKEMEELNTRLLDIKKSKDLVIPDNVEQWLRGHYHGVDWGWGLKIVWLSEDTRWAIITNKGGIAGQGTPMGSAGYYYARTEHWISPTFINIMGYNSDLMFHRVEGKLTKEIKQKMIDAIPELEKQLNN